MVENYTVKVGGIEYKNAMLDFSKVSEAEFNLSNMTSNRSKNFKAADEMLVDEWNKVAKDGKNNWTVKDVRDWRTSNKFTWHELNDGITIQLVPTEINSGFGHLGGISELK